MAKCTKRTWTHNGIVKTTFVVRFTDKSGKGNQKTFRLKKDGEAFARVVTDELIRGTHTSSSKATSVTDVCDLFIKLQEDRWKSGVISQSRYANLRKTVNSVVPIIGKRLFHELKPHDIQDCYRTLVRLRGLARGQRETGLSTFA